MAGPQIIYGAAGISQLSGDEQKETFSVLQKHNVKTLDTAYIYV